MIKKMGNRMIMITKGQEGSYRVGTLSKKNLIVSVRCGFSKKEMFDLNYIPELLGPHIQKIRLGYKKHIFIYFIIKKW